MVNSLFLSQEHIFFHPSNHNRCQTTTVFKGVEGHQLPWDFSVTRIRFSCAVSSTPAAPLQEDKEEEEEEVRRRMMARRVKIIAELLQTEKDYISDLDLCIKEVIQPLRNMQVSAGVEDEVVMSRSQLSHVLLVDNLRASTSVREVFLQIKGPLEDTYKIYCYHHDDAHTMLEYYEKDEELKQHLRGCVQSLKGKPNLMDLGSLLIKPVQRLMKYPLLLRELLNSTPASHPDHEALQHALFTMRTINWNINELKRRKDLVLKYRKNDDDETLKEKFARLNIHSISKKSKRVTSHLKILTRGEPQVKDGTFDKEEKFFQSLEKTVKLCVKNISLYSQHLQVGTGLSAICDHKPLGLVCTFQMAQLDKLVLTPLSALQALFPSPQKLIQKRYDKLLDYNSYIQRSAGEELELAKKEYEALNAQLVEELQVFNRAAKKIVLNCLHCFITLLRNIIFLAEAISVHPPCPATTCPCEMPLSSFPSPRQTEEHRSKLLATYSTESLYQAKRKCNAAQEFDIDLQEGELVAVVEQKDPFGSTSRWLVDTGILTGYVYSSFLKPYNPAKAQKDVAENGFGDDDFDDISLFVSSRFPADGSTSSPGYQESESSSPLHFCENPAINGTGTGALQGMDDQEVSMIHTVPVFLTATDTQLHSNMWLHFSILIFVYVAFLFQIFYAVFAFQARSDQELSLQEYQRVRILRFSDLSGNKEWWLAEAKGQKGYVPSNYLGKMTYA
uniref:Dynamin-binding protein n=1 Tax=Geospiza parvula TaxID=87175 RepID=A0A8U8ALI9_GEOPR